MDNLFTSQYLNKPYCSIDTPFERMGFLKCHRSFYDREMFDVLCELQREYKKQQKTISFLEGRLKKYEPWDFYEEIG